jgi:hypothetical protein
VITTTQQILDLEEAQTWGYVNKKVMDNLWDTLQVMNGLVKLAVEKKKNEQ